MQSNETAPVNIASVRHRLRHLLLNLVAFNVCYLLSNAIAQQQAIQRHVALPFEVHIPFLQWMIVPYLSSGLFFCFGFAWVRTPDQLRVLSQRLLLATVLAAFVFYFYPLQFSWPRPVMSVAPFAILFDFLAVVDRPYNQLPSLHVAFCLIFWQSLRSLVTHPPTRVILAAWLLLTALATVFTYQHHVLDVVGGLLLGILCIACIRPGRRHPHVAFYYLMASGTVFLVAVLMAGHVWAVYFAVSLLLVSGAYMRGDRFFLNKQQGRLPLKAWLLYGPYLLGYWLTWHVVRWRERKHGTVQYITDQLMIGRRLGDAEVGQLPLNCTVVDLSNELNETAALRTHPYWHVPLLDLAAIPPQASSQIMTLLQDEIRAGRVVYLHCSMGYSRCKQLADAYLATRTP